MKILNYKRYLSELIATFFLIFCGTGAVVINEQGGEVIGHLGIAISFGLIVTIMILSLREISGTHMNPVVTLIFVALKIHPKKDLIPYIIFQTIGAILASTTLLLLFPQNKMLGTTIPAGSEMQSFVLEVILTFLLVFVILFMSQGSDHQKQFAPFGIGLTVLLEALFAGPICGASMNPIRSLAPALVSGHLESLWVYIAAPTLGAILAALVWKISVIKGEKI